MAYTPHTLMEFGGLLSEAGSYGEIWSCGIRCFSINNNAPVTSANLDAYLDALAPLLLAYWNVPQNGMVTTATLGHLKLNNINAAGRYAEDTTHQHDYAAGLNGPNSQLAPNFCSVVWTWETGIARGRAHRGRMYPPNPSYAPQGGKISGTDRDSAANAAQRFIHDVCRAIRGTAVEDMLSPHVFSKLDGSHHPITGATVDDVYDVQRRRKNQAHPSRSALVPVNTAV